MLLPSLRQNIQNIQRVTAGTIPGTGMTIVINGPVSERVITMATDGFMTRTTTTTTTDAWRKRNPGDDWHTSHCETSRWWANQWKTSGWNVTGKCSDDREGQPWPNHSFFETMSVDQLINSLCRGLRSIQVSHWLTQLHRVESLTFVRFGRPKRLSSTSLDSNCVSSLATTEQWALEAKPRCWERWRCLSGMGFVNGVVKYTVVDSPGVPPLTPVSLLKQVGIVIDLNSNTMDLKKVETSPHPFWLRSYLGPSEHCGSVRPRVSQVLFDLLIQVPATHLSLFFCAYSSDRASEDALHTSLPGSPPLSSNVRSPNGSGHDLDGMCQRSIDAQFKGLRDIVTTRAWIRRFLTNTSRPSVKPWVWSPPELPVLNKLSMPSLPRWRCLQRWSSISITSLRVCARSRHMLPLHQMYRVQHDPSPRWNILTAPQLQGSMAQGHLMTTGTHDEGLILLQAQKMNNHELPSFVDSLENKTSKEVHSGSINLGKNLVCWHATNLKGFIAKQVLCWPGLFLIFLMQFAHSTACISHCTAQDEPPNVSVRASFHLHVIHDVCLSVRCPSLCVCLCPVSLR